MIISEVINRVGSLLDIDSLQIELIPIGEGKNNRSYRCSTRSGRYFVKVYFDDSRNRGRTEYVFVEHCAAVRIENVARPVAFEPSPPLGVFEYIEGDPFHSGDIGDPEIEAASNFFKALNSDQNGASSLHLASAAEACFSFQEHIATVDSRVKRLMNIEVNDDISSQAKSLVDTEIGTRWHAIRQELRSSKGIDGTAEGTRRCISPSDFGFHNALRSGDKIYFVDFEYAGWDDPAKTICDFFCQPRVPVPLKFLDRVVESFSASTGGDGSLAQRVRKLLPLYRIKWCCILLNEFVPEDSQRRSFALHKHIHESRNEADDRRKTQLEKALKMIQAIQ